MAYTAPDGFMTAEPFMVRPPAVEFDDVRMAADTMRSMATRTGGVYADGGGISPIIDAVPDLSRTVVQMGPLEPVWSTWLVLGLALAALATEWVFRKLMGLV
jgi:hypothetical protein